MRTFIFLSMVFCLYGFVSLAQKQDERYYELRIYYCEPGKLPDLLNRFRNHTTKLLEKHGMTNVGYWTPIHNESNALYYILSYPDKASRESSWKAFMEDPVWHKVRKESEENGKIVSKVESIFLKTTDFSPKVKTSMKGDRVFEMRTYTCPEGKLPNLLSRFRDHTLKLFKKHGMTNIAYWTTMETDGSQSRLLYLLAHNSEAAGKASFESFRQDPQWIKARDESEKAGKIVDKVESIYMNATDFSGIK